MFFFVNTAGTVCIHSKTNLKEKDKQKTLKRGVVIIKITQLWLAAVLSFCIKNSISSYACSFSNAFCVCVLTSCAFSSFFRLA